MKERIELQHALLVLAKVVPCGEKGYPISALCRELDLTYSQLAQVADLLSRCEVPPGDPSDIITVEMEGDRITIAFADYFQGPLRFSAEEALALRLAMEWCKAQAVPWMDSADQLLAKLAAVLDEHETNGDREQVVVSPRSTPPVDLECLSEAARLCHVVQFVYYAQYKDETRRRVVWPISLFHTGEAWYLKAYVPEVNGYRRYHTGRMHEVTVLDEEYDPASLPSEGPTEPIFDWKAEAVPVRLWFSPTVAVPAREMFADQTVESLPDGGVIVHTHAYGPAFIRRCVLAYGEEAEILDPPELRAYMRDFLAAYAQAIAPPAS